MPIDKPATGPATPATESAPMIGEALHPTAPETSLLVTRKDVLDRIADLAQQSQSFEIVELTAPDGMNGVPAKIPAIYKHGASPTLAGVEQLFEPYRTNPARRKGTATADTLQSFISLVRRHMDGDSAIFAATTFPNVKLTAIIDYNRTAKEADAADRDLEHEPRWGQHRVAYAFPLTDEFKAWMKMDGEPFKQIEFAQFLEEHIAELAAPYAAEQSDYEPKFGAKFALPMELIELSRFLEVNVKQAFKQSNRLQSGERKIVFESEHVNSQGEAIVIPGIFMISVPAWIDGEPVRIPARLRYRTAGSEVIWFYDLYKPDFWLREQVINDATTASSETGLPVYLGAPET